MSQILQIEVPDLLYKAIESEAAAHGRNPATVVVSALEQHFQTKPDVQLGANTSDTFEALFGAAAMGHPASLDNDAIDADLAREYARGLTN
jgi:hypothetical protein